MRRCLDCALPLGKKDMFCPRCGSKQPREPKLASRVSAILLLTAVPHALPPASSSELRFTAFTMLM